MVEETGFWGVVEQMGHKKLAGYVSEVTMAGHGFLRIDVPSDDPTKWAATQFISPASGSIYAITPVSEAAARLVAKGHRPEPVSVWELPQIEHRGRENDGPSEFFCSELVDADNEHGQSQCGAPAFYNSDAQDFRCEKHGGSPI